MRQVDGTVGSHPAKGFLDSAQFVLSEQRALVCGLYVEFYNHTSRKDDKVTRHAEGGVASGQELLADVTEVVFDELGVVDSPVERGGRN